MSLLYGKNLKMLPKIKIVLPLLSDATQVKYNAGTAMQNNAAQHWTNSTLLESKNILKYLPDSSSRFFW